MTRHQSFQHRPLVASLGAAVLAAIASQHHLLHMLLLTFGVGGANLMDVSPTLRRAILVLSLALLGAAVYRATRRPSSPFGKFLLGVSIITTLGFMAWSLMYYGL